jgi:hypothetical protein
VPAHAAARGARRPAQGRLHSDADREAARDAAESGVATKQWDGAPQAVLDKLGVKYEA